jgi:hypothetical protein
VTISGAPWLTIAPLGAITPNTLVVTVTPPVVAAPGTLNGTIIIGPSASANAVGMAVPVSLEVLGQAPGNPIVNPGDIVFDDPPGSPAPPPAGFGSWLSVNQSNQCMLADIDTTVAAAPFLTASPFGLVFSYQIGGASPPLQAVVISAQGNPVPFSVGAETTSGANWLLAAGGGTTPATVAATIDPGALSRGTYAGNLIMKPNDSSGLELRVPVILNVAADPVFVPSVNQISFRYQRDGSLPRSQKVAINTSSAGPTVFYPTIQTSDNGQWLKVTPDSATSPADLTVSVDPQGLAPGLYSAVIGVNAAAGDTPMSSVPVSLQVSDTPLLVAASQTITFNAKTGGSAATAQTITVHGTGSKSVFQATTSGGTWLQVSPTNGRTDANLNVTAAPDGLGTGYYLGVVSLEIPGVAGSEQFVPVVLVVSVP